MRMVDMLKKAGEMMEDHDLTSHRLRDGLWKPDLVCHMVGLEYDAVSHTGMLWLRHGNCTDMRGAINLFLSIDPGVEKVLTFQLGAQPGDPDIPHTAYARKQQNEWYAIPHIAMRAHFAEHGMPIPQRPEWKT